jgi:hypothetical protein
MRPEIAREAPTSAPQVFDGQTRLRRGYGGQTPLPQFSRCIKIPTRSARAFRSDGKCLWLAHTVAAGVENRASGGGRLDRVTSGNGGVIHSQSSL